MLGWAASCADYKLHRFIRADCLRCSFHFFHDLWLFIAKHRFFHFNFSLTLIWLVACSCSYSKPRGMHCDGFCLWNTAFSACLASLYDSETREHWKTGLPTPDTSSADVLRPSSTPGALRRGFRAGLSTSSPSGEKQGACEREIGCSESGRQERAKQQILSIWKGPERRGAAGREMPALELVQKHWLCHMQPLHSGLVLLWRGRPLHLNHGDHQHLLEISVKEKCVSTWWGDQRDRRKQLFCGRAAQPRARETAWVENRCSGHGGRCFMNDLCCGLHVCMNVSAGPLGGQRCSTVLELESETVVSCLTWVLGAQLRSSGRTGGVLNHQPSLCPGFSAAVHQTQETSLPLNSDYMASSVASN